MGTMDNQHLASPSDSPHCNRKTSITVVTDSKSAIDTIRKHKVSSIRKLIRSDTKDVTSKIVQMHKRANETNTAIHFLHQQGHTISKYRHNNIPPTVLLQDICDSYARVASNSGRSTEPHFFSPFENLVGLSWILLEGTSLADSKIVLDDYYKTIYRQYQHYLIHRASHSPLISILKDIIIGKDHISVAAQEIIANKISTTSASLYICRNLGIQPAYLLPIAEEHANFAYAIPEGNHHPQNSTP